MIDICSDMTGSVWKILVKPGQTVNDGDAVIIIEAMKMEVLVMAMDSGTVAEILVKENDMVEDGDVVIRLKG